MKLPFVSRRHHERELAYVNADRERIRGERDQFAKDRDAHRAEAQATAEKFAAADTANRRLEGRIAELTKRVEERPSFEDSAALKRQIRSLQKRLDDAVGLAGRVPEDSARWQPGCQKPKPNGGAL